MKKIILSILAILLPVISINFTGCSNENIESKTILTLSLNPKIEFITDNSGIVLTASALNNEGNFILINDNFVGDTYENCSLKFVQLCLDYGFIENCETSQNIEVAIKGKNANLKYENIEEVIEEFVEKKECSLKVEYKTLGDDYLKNSTLKAYKNLSSLDGYNNEQILDMLIKSRIETQNLYTQELKEFYYQDKAIKVLNAEITAISSFIKEKNVPALNTMLNGVETSLNTATSQLEEMSNSFLNDYLKGDGNYRNKTNEYIKNKRAILEYNLNNSENQNVDLLKEEFNKSKKSLDEAYSEMENYLSVPIRSFLTIKDTVYNGVLILFSDVKNIVSEASLKASENYNMTFSSYGLVNDENYWKELNPNKNS